MDLEIRRLYICSPRVNQKHLKLRLWSMVVVPVSCSGGEQDHVTLRGVFLQLQEQLAEVENERDLLKESNAKLLNRFGSVILSRVLRCF